jgi:solute:Na+ symporter, SSS family
MEPTMKQSLVEKANDIGFLTTQAQVGEPIDIIIIIAYFFIIMAFGALMSRGSRGTKDFFFGGQRFAWWVIAMSIVASGVGSYSFVKYSSMGYMYGLSSTMTYLNDWFFVPFFMFGWLPIIYFSRVQSIPEYFERRFNGYVRFGAVVIMLLYMLGYIGINLYTLGVAMYRIMGVDVMTAVIIIAIITGAYVTFGGQTAVIFTDLLQGFILIFAGILLFALGLHYIGGISELWYKLFPMDARLPLSHPIDPAEFPAIGIFWQDGVAGSIAFLFMNQGLIMRFLATKSVKEGRKALLINTLFFLPISTIVVCNAGWIGKILVGNAIEVNGAVLGPGVDPNDIFVLVTALVSQPGVFGFIMAALTAALMSTVDTLINATSAVFINDVYRPYWVKGKDDKHYLMVARVVSIVAVVIGVLLVPLFMGFATIYEAHGTFLATVTPPLVVAIFLGAFWKGYTNAGALATFIGGVVMIILGNIFPETLLGIFSHGIDVSGGSKFIGALYNLLVCAFFGVAVSAFTKPKTDKEMLGLCVWSIESAKEMYKGGKPNETMGKKVLAEWRINDDEETDVEKTVVHLSNKDMQAMDIYEGDVIYLEDHRRWLGGLISAHSKVGAPHDESGIVYIPKSLKEYANFKSKRRLRLEKII